MAQCLARHRPRLTARERLHRASLRKRARRGPAGTDRRRAQANLPPLAGAALCGQEPVDVAGEVTVAGSASMRERPRHRGRRAGAPVQAGQCWWAPSTWTNTPTASPPRTAHAGRLPQPARPAAAARRPPAGSVPRSRPARCRSRWAQRHQRPRSASRLPCGIWAFLRPPVAPRQLPFVATCLDHLGPMADRWDLALPTTRCSTGTRPTPAARRWPSNLPC